MIRFNPDQDKLQRLEELRKEKEEKEDELEELEEQKKEELKKLEQRLQEAVAELAEPDEEELAQEEEPEEQEEQEEEPESIDEAVEQEREREIRESGPVYDIERSDLEALPELYDELSSENPASAAVDRAREIVYSLQHNEEETYVSRDAQDFVERDMSDQGAHYVERLSALIDRFESRTDKGAYQNRNQQDHV